MELRRAFANDWSAVRDVRLRALTQDPSAFCSTLDRELAFDEHAWRSRLADGITVLAWADDAPVATAAQDTQEVSGAPVTPMATARGKADPHEAGGKEIVGMWVDPAKRGSGVADSLISTVIEWAQSEGAHEVALWVAGGNDRARAFYERCGFTATGERDSMPSGVDQIRMRMSLTNER